MRENILNEQLLVERLRNGDAAAFRTLYESSGTRLQGFAARFRLSRDEADEIVQETFIRVWRHRAGIDPTASFSTYIITIAKHLIYNHLKKTGHKNAWLKEIGGELKSQPGHLVINQRELQQEIAKAINLLPGKCAEVFRKSRLEGYSNQEIADDLNISKSTVENQLNKALKLIRRFLESRGYGLLIIIFVLGGGADIFI